MLNECTKSDRPLRIRVQVSSRQRRPGSKWEVLQPGDRMTTFEAGGAGYGDPARRALDRVRADVRNGYVSAEAAKRDYAVDPWPPDLPGIVGES
jgi:N-methylhydantoinase B/oxoprolinase/acetone carboxylase alpha subunit